MDTNPAIKGLVADAVYEIYRYVFNPPRKNRDLPDNIGFFITDLNKNLRLPEDVIEAIKSEAISPHYLTVNITREDAVKRMLKVVNDSAFEDGDYEPLVKMLMSWLDQEGTQFRIDTQTRTPGAVLTASVVAFNHIFYELFGDGPEIEEDVEIFLMALNDDPVLPPDVKQAIQYDNKRTHFETGELHIDPKTIDKDITTYLNQKLFAPTNELIQLMTSLIHSAIMEEES